MSFLLFISQEGVCFLCKTDPIPLFTHPSIFYQPPLTCSWDRMPFVTTVRDGVNPSSIPAMNEFHHSFVVSNYAADGGCLDNECVVGPFSPSQPFLSCTSYSQCTFPSPPSTFSTHVSFFAPALACSDGSAYYHISYNFCVAGGHKSDFDGHGKVREGGGGGE